jgi:SET domain-containing protein
MAEEMKFMVKETVRKGFGLYSEKDYSEGELVLDESPFNSHHTLISDFINHSCNPNLEYDLQQFRFYALKPISMGDELTYDYESTELDRENLDFSCYCESTKCRKIISGKKQ